MVWEFVGGTIRYVSSANLSNEFPLDPGRNLELLKIKATGPNPDPWKKLALISSRVDNVPANFVQCNSLTRVDHIIIFHCECGPCKFGKPRNFWNRIHLINMNSLHHSFWKHCHKSPIQFCPVIYTIYQILLYSIYITDCFCFTNLSLCIDRQLDVFLRLQLSKMIGNSGTD